MWMRRRRPKLGAWSIQRGSCGGRVAVHKTYVSALSSRETWRRDGAAHLMSGKPGFSPL